MLTVHQAVLFYYHFPLTARQADCAGTWSRCNGAVEVEVGVEVDLVDGGRTGRYGMVRPGFQNMMSARSSLSSLSLSSSSSSSPSS